MKKLALITINGNGLLNAVDSQRKNNEQFNLSLEGANSNLFLAHDFPAMQNILQLEKMCGLHKSEFCVCVLLQTDHILLK